MTTDEYLQEVTRVIQTNFHSNDPGGGITAAKVGIILSQVIKDPPQAFGSNQLRDVLLSLESRGVLRTGPNSKKALSIWLTGGNSPTTSAVPPNQAPSPDRGPALQTVQTNSVLTFVAQSPFGRFQPLKNSIWLAFVSETPVGRRFFNKQTGEVRLGQGAAPGTSEVWVEIKPIDKAAEQEDARSFLRSEARGSDQTLTDALNNANWWHIFPQALRQADPFLASKWNRRRSNRVIVAAEAWRNENDIPKDLVYETAQRKEPLPPPARISNREIFHKSSLKESLLDAIQHMSVEEILELPIPTKYLVAALRPDLLQ